MTQYVQADPDTIVERLTVGEKAWAATPLADRRRMLLALRKNLADAAAEWVEIACGIKGLPKDSPLVGEEWISGPWSVLSFTGALAETLKMLNKGEDVLAGVRFDKAPGNRVAVHVSPHGTFDQSLFSGFRSEVWLRPGVTKAAARARVGLGQRAPEQTQGVALVLGGGNIFSLAPLDTLQQLFAANRVVVLKPNPITEPLRPVYELIFAPFIELGAVEIVTGDAQFGDTLAHHPGVGAVHMTGSEATHNAIVWGVGDDAEAARRPAPLGCTSRSPANSGVSPVIVVPGEWSETDLKFQAEHVATQRLHNSGHNCVASQILIVSSDWAQKDAFLSNRARRSPPRPCDPRGIPAARSAWPRPGTCTPPRRPSAGLPSAPSSPGSTSATRATALSTQSISDPCSASPSYPAPGSGS